MNTDEPREALRNKDTWPELVCRLVEHYKYEPQHLGKGEPREKFWERIRRQEVPLNFLFQILLRLSSSDTISALLKLFHVGAETVAGHQWRLRFPEDENFTQPDVVIESEQARVFIEIKVGATLSMEQVQKYLVLHALKDIHTGQKQHYLLFLAPSEFIQFWRPRAEMPSTAGIQGFLQRAIADAAMPANLEKRLVREGAAGQYEAVKQDVRYGAATWTSVRICLEEIGARMKKEAPQSLEIPLIDDFVYELTLHQNLCR